MASEEDALESMGLTRNEARVYVALLKLKSALAGEVTATSGIHRRNVYDSLERLEEKGLVSFTVKNNRRYFQPAPPKRLTDLLKERENVVQAALPRLEELFGRMAEREGIRVYTGIEGYKTMLEDIIATLPLKSEWLSIPSARIVKRIPTFMKFMHKRRVAKKILLKAIYNEDETGLTRAREVSKLPLTDIRTLLLSREAVSGMNIYGKKCWMTVVSDTDELTVIVFENEAVTRSFKNYFEALWKEAKPVARTI